MGLLWKDLNLDSLVINCYAPGHSRFNPIERSWSFLTNKITTVILPDNIDGVTPNYNDDAGWVKVLDNTVDVCSRFWDKKLYYGFPISVETFKSDNPNIPQIKNCHENLKNFANCSKKKLKETHEYLQLQDTYKFVVRHSNRKAYQLEFVRCQNHQCSHCTTLPARDNKFVQLIREFGGSCPAPIQSDVHTDHYKTFLEVLRIRGHTSNIYYYSTPFGSCEFGCSYLCFSQADKMRHMKFMKH